MQTVGNFLNEVNALITAHPYLAMIMVWLVGNICASFPTPTPDSGKFYIFIFNLASLVGGALPRSLPQLRLGTSRPLAPPPAGP